MVNKSVYTILLGILIVFSAVFVEGCGSSVKKSASDREGKEESIQTESLQDGGNGSQEEPLQEESGFGAVEPNNAISDSDRDAVSGGVDQEKSWAELREELRPSIVQIYCGDYLGSGVIWEVTEKEVTIVSVGHLLKNAESCEVVFHNGRYYEAQVAELSENQDIGFAVIPTEELEADEMELIPVMPYGGKPEELIQGEELAVYGSMDYVAGNFVEGYLVRAEMELELPVYEKKQVLLLGKIKNQAASENGEGIDAGMSGSGVFDRQGCLLGILAGGDETDTFAAVPVWIFRGETDDSHEFD